MDKTYPMPKVLADDRAKERVEHPDHYNWIPDVECIDVVECFDFNLGCVVKYVWRSAHNNDKVEAIIDLRKAVFYLKREIDLLRLRGALHEPLGAPKEGPSKN
jgi:hypothetical protein